MSSHQHEHITTEAEDRSSDLDVGMLKTAAQKALVDALNSINGAKTLVLDPSLAGPLSLVTEVSLLKHHGVDKMFWLEVGPLSATTTNVVYLCRPQIKWMKIVVDQIKQLNQGSTTHTFHLILVPRRTTLCDRILEEEGVLGELNISSYKLEFIPLENDLVSLEWENVWREIYVDGDDTSIFYSAQALNTIQQAYGLFPRIVGKGDAAKRLKDLLTRSRPPASSQNPSTLSHASTVIDGLIIIDRNVDIITPLLTQLTYEGLIDEFFQIQNSHVRVDPLLLSTSNQPGTTSPGAPSTPLPSTSGLPSTAASQTKRKYHLRSTDRLYEDLRDLNFAIVGGKLNKEARRLDAEYKGRHQAQTVSQLRDFVGKLGGLQNEHQALRLHTGLSEQISTLTRTEHFNKSLEIQQNLLQGYDTSAQITAIEDLVAQQAPVQNVLRLMCLANLVTGGYKAKVLENLKREFLQTYGYHYVPLLLSLASRSLLNSLPLPKNSKIPAPPPFGPIRKNLRLLSDTEEAAPTDISFTYSGYAPLSIRLVQCVAQKAAVMASPTPVENPKGAQNGTSAGAGTTDGNTGPTPLPPALPIAGWKGFEDVVKLLPGATVDHVEENEQPAESRGPAPRTQQSQTTVVFFLGGCTFTEVAALRWMNTQMRGRRFLIATTGMVNGTTLLESLGDGPAVKFATQA